MVRDPRTVPLWHNLSTLTGYPGNVIGVALNEDLVNLNVTVLSSTGTVARTSCLAQPTPGTLLNPAAWPTNCSAFVNITPPN
ncbi:hypothetical protein SAMN05216276_1003207 [Streptosporangium subroseum]|uniref:Uncharacterized protein n=1 Tax=Streptosporangium subroseum TaxID=106412 RepID=A0A239BIE0_9ACTN|nr:hypothetical protein SAMN05216276_1003207 [Streptosporangium subroseum]